jgi:DNA-binding transcriptional ArsR family regulator
MRANRQLETIVKGFANHRRIEIMELLEQEPDLSLMDISSRTNINFKTASEHLRRLELAGLVYKTNDGNFVLHTLSPRGRDVLDFIHTLE